MSGPAGTLERRSTPDGSTVYVDLGDHEPGGFADFNPSYADPDASDRLGFACGHCGSLDASMDTMGRIECGGCENARLPTRHDAGYL